MPGPVGVVPETRELWKTHREYICMPSCNLAPACICTTYVLLRLLISTSGPDMLDTTVEHPRMNQ